jgi:pimeloyl-ACP methyl ester carboxylesterase
MSTDGCKVRGSVVLAVLLSTVFVACSSASRVIAPVDIDPVEWEACDEFPGDDTVECGTVTVPLDYRNPDEQTIDIALLRYPAQSSKAKGVLLVNDGGPGSSGVDFAYYSGPDMIDSLGLEDFDIVGFDPRGVDRSGGLKCQTDDEMDRFMYLDYTPDDDDEQALYDEWLEAEDPCVVEYGEELRNYSTENIARDMDQIRQAMNVEQIHFLGISWGTYLGGVYATLFPDNVRSMFLDAAYDPQGDSADESALTQAVGFEKSFDAWVEWCEDDAEACAFSSSDVKADWLALEDELDAEPLVADDGREVNHVVMETATISVLYSEADWPFLGDALASAADGDGQALLEMADFWMGRAEDGSYATLVDAYSIIECASGTYAYEPENPEALLEQLKDEAPWYSRDYEAEDLGASCDDAFGDPDIFEIDVTASLPIVVLGGTNDPATPMRWSEEMVLRLGDKARLAVFNGEGHSHILASRCVDEIASELFTSLRLPADGTECDPDVLVEKPQWWDGIVDIDAPRLDDATMDWYFDTDRVDAYAEYFAVPGDGTEAFAIVREHFEDRGWTYEEGESADPVANVQWFVDPDDEFRNVGVWLSSPEELAEYQMVEPDGEVPAGTSVVLVYYWP